jgi:riboflavin biosynthesis pyrimidine reductase
MVEIVSLVPSVAGPLSDSQLAEHYSDGAGQHWLRVNFVSSVDGAATVDGVSGGLGGEADHRVFDLLRTLCDVVLVAAGTVRKEGYGAMRLGDADVAARVARGLAAQPVFAIATGSLDLDPTSPVFTEAPVRPVVFTSSAATANSALEQVADVIVAGETSVEAKPMLAALAERGLTRIHCEGGPSFFGSLLAADVVDELCLTVSPLLAGGDSGRIVHGDLPSPRALSLAGVLQSENALLLRYLRNR